MDGCSVSTHSKTSNTYKVLVKAFSVEVWYRFKISNTRHTDEIIFVFQGRSGTVSPLFSFLSSAYFSKIYIQERSDLLNVVSQLLILNVSFPEKQTYRTIWKKYYLQFKPLNTEPEGNMLQSSSKYLNSIHESYSCSEIHTAIQNILD